MPGEQPMVIDVAARDIRGEEQRLRERGPVSLVELPLGVTAWAVTDYETVRRLLTDSRVSRSARLHWAAWKRGEIPENWPLRVWADVDNMGNSYGDEHRRLRGLMSDAFTARRVEKMGPWIKELVGKLLDAIDARASGEVVDLKATFAYRVPTDVISELFGVPGEMRPALEKNVKTAFETGADPREIHASVGALMQLLVDLVELKRQRPGDDLTTAMLRVKGADGTVFTDKEVVDTLSLMMVAGHETTANLIDNAITNLLTHPDQLELVRTGKQTWDDVVEEALRLDAPVRYLPLRYAVEDLQIGEVTIPAGDAILVSYGSAGRDPARYGDDADEFDITREDKQHLSFGHGVHYCLGAPMARLEARTALPALFERYPGLALAVPPSELEPLNSFLTNGHTTVPVHRR